MEVMGSAVSSGRVKLRIKAKILSQLTSDWRYQRPPVALAVSIDQSASCPSIGQKVLQRLYDKSCFRQTYLHIGHRLSSVGVEIVKIGCKVGAYVGISNSSISLRSASTSCTLK